jgi:hypothetical protein
MNDTPPMAMTIRPTEKFFMAGTVMVRAWTGKTRDGIEVVALVASVALPSGGPMPGLKPIPPPIPAWEPRTRAAVGRIWNIAGKMLPEEIEGLATAMEHLAGKGWPLEYRKKLADDFLLRVMVDDDGP